MISDTQLAIISWIALENYSPYLRSHTFTGFPRSIGKRLKRPGKKLKGYVLYHLTQINCNFCVLHRKPTVLRDGHSMRNQVCAQPTSTSTCSFHGPWPLPLLQLLILFRITHKSRALISTPI